MPKEISKYRHTKSELQMFQNMDLDLKIAKAKIRIQEWYEHYDGNVYISFSGGKDSTVLLHLVRSLYHNVEAVYCDTGLEYPEIKEFVRTFDNVVWLKPKMNFRQVIEKYGYPIISKEVSQKLNDIQTTKSDKLRNKRLYGDDKGNGKLPIKYQYLIKSPFKISHKCCNVMKKSPIHSYENKTKKVGYIGTMTDESRLREQSWLESGCNAFDLAKPQSRPLSFWTEQDVLQYIKMFNLEISSVYGDIVEDDGILSTTKCKRTGCVFCMFGCHLEKSPNRFEQMNSSHPKLYNYCMKSIEAGGLGLDEILTFNKIKH